MKHVYLGYLLCGPLLSVSLLTGCYRWGAIDGKFTNGNAYSDETVRIGGEGGQVVQDATLRWPLLSWVGNQRVTLDLREIPPASVELPAESASAIAHGQTIKLESVRVRGEIISHATLHWPMLYGTRRSKGHQELELTGLAAERQEISPTGYAVGIGGPLLGLVTLGVFIGVAVGLGSGVGYPQ